MALPPLPAPRADWSAWGSAVHAAAVQATEGTPVGTPITIKPSTDTRAGVWEYVHDAPTGYLFHLMNGTNSNAPLIGMGIDNGGVGLFVNNKATGIGIKIDQNNTITSGTAFGLQVEQKSTVAPAVMIYQTQAGAQPAMQFRNTGNAVTDAESLLLVQVGSGATTAGMITAKTGLLKWHADILAYGSSFHSRANSADADLNTHHLYSDYNGWEVDAASGSGVQANAWWVGRIYRNGWAMDFQAGQGFSDRAGAGTTMNTLIRLSYGGKLGFFGSDGVATRPTVRAAATDAATTQTLANDLRTALINLGLVA